MPLITKKGGIQRFKKAKLHSFAEPPSVSSVIIVLHWYLHQLESHRLSLSGVSHSVTDIRAIDWTPCSDHLL